MKAVIVEDEKKNSVQLRKLLASNCPQVSVVGECADADSGQAMIRSLQPDLVFLDIQLPGKSGFDMLSEMSPHPFDIIFVSGYDQYGIQAIKCSALDYLLKPVKPKELVEAVRKAENHSSRKWHEEKITNLLSYFDQGDTGNRKIVLQLMKETRFVRIADIVHCESENAYTKFYMRDGEQLIVSKGLYAFEEQLLLAGFTRPHKSYLVNIAYIKSIRKEVGIPELLLTTNQRIPISERKLEQVKRDLIAAR